MKPYAAYIFDLDGTLYRGEAAIPGAVDTLAELRRRGAVIRFVTNNSSQTRAFYSEKLGRLGFEAEKGEIHSSATGTAVYLREQGLDSAFVVGMPGLVRTLGEGGAEVVNVGGDDHVTPEGRTARAVVVGICQELSYDLLNGAMQQIAGGARFIATNPDPTFPLEGSRIVPGAGSMVAAVQACSGTIPFVVGKPNPYLIELALAEAGIDPKDALAVGDRLDTDIESGRRAGCDTHLVLTGVEISAPPGQSFSPDLRALSG